MDMASTKSPQPGQAMDMCKSEAEGLVLTKRPLKTLKFFSMALLQYLDQLLSNLSSHKLLVVVSCLGLYGWRALSSVQGPHEQIMKEMSAYAQYALWWVGLGILSSIGLGSGLHTFVLYLGPHIAMYTLKAGLCGRADLKAAPYDTIMFSMKPTWQSKDCLNYGEPLFPQAANSDGFRVPMLPILHQVQLEAILWGIGTALGELPPYFVSKTAKLSGERLRDYEDLKLNISSNDTSNSVTKYLGKLKSQFVELFEQLNFNRYRFWIILIFASVPNPLFDLAGIMCGQLLVPFWGFFIPTVIGKGLVKTHIQTMFVILICNNQLVEHLESSLRQLFRHMPALSSFISQLLFHIQKTQHNYHKGPVMNKESPWKISIQLVWNTVVWIMIIGFFNSIINTTAQSYVIEKQRREHGKVVRKDGAKQMT